MLLHAFFYLWHGICLLLPCKWLFLYFFGYYVGVKLSIGASDAPNWCHPLTLLPFGAADIAKNKHFYFNLFTISYFLTV